MAGIVTAGCKAKERGYVSGYLYKMKRNGRRFMPLWSKRFFSIEGSNVRYYRSEDSVKASGAVNFFEIRCIKPFETRSDQNIFSLQIVANSRSFFLRTHSAAVRDRWVLELNYYLRVWTGRGGRAAQGRGELAEGKMGSGPGHDSAGHCHDHLPYTGRGADDDDVDGERTSYASSYASDGENNEAMDDPPPANNYNNNAANARSQHQGSRDHHTITATTLLPPSPTAFQERRFRGGKRRVSHDPTHGNVLGFQTMPGQVERGRGGSGGGRN